VKVFSLALRENLSSYYSLKEMSMLSQKLYNPNTPSDCGNNNLSGQTSISPQPYNIPYGGQYGSPSGMSPPVNAYGAIGSPGSGTNTNNNNGPSNCIGGSSGYNNGGVGGLNSSSGSCDNLTAMGGSGVSPRSASFRESSVISNGGSVNSAAAAAKTYRRSYTHAKPPYSYISLITMAIQVSFF